MPSQPTSGSRLTLEWTGGQAFRAKSPAGVEIDLDGESKTAFSPMQALATALGGCMGIDVVVILSKMRLDLKGLRVLVDAERREAPPRSFGRMRIHFEITGEVPLNQAERAVALSRESYCSVLHTLRPDLEIETSIELAER